MTDSDRPIPFYVLPSKEGIEEARKRLQELGIEGIQTSSNGKRLNLSLARQLLERVFDISLKEKSRRIRIGPVRVTVREFDWPEDAELPPRLRDVIDKVVFPRYPDYH